MDFVVISNILVGWLLDMRVFEGREEECLINWRKEDWSGAWKEDEQRGEGGRRTRDCESE